MSSMLSEVIQKIDMMQNYLWEIIDRIVAVLKIPNEIIGTIGIAVFIFSAPLGFAIAVYESYHPEAQKKMQDLCERHNKIFITVILLYVILAMWGICYWIASSC